MTSLEIVTIGDIEYYNATELHKSDPNFFYGCANNTRNIITKKNIKTKDIKWAYIKSDEWVISKKSYAKAKLLLTKEWVCDNVPMFAKNNKVKYEIDPAPELLILDDAEKLTDCDGNVMEIETRGERDVDKCYFRVKDVSKCFEIKNLSKTILNKDRGYSKNVHYKYFTSKESINGEKIKVNKRLYFTYNGLIRCLYVSRNKHADKFTKWASRILFTVQMGSKEQKEELSSKLLGVSARAVKEVFKTSSTTIPCVYLFSLGTAKRLRVKMKIDSKYTDDMIVCKYGFTKDLPRRTAEHIKEYGKIKKVDLKLKYHSYIDPQYCSDAEADIRGFFEALDIGFGYKKYDELVIIKPSLFKTVENQYKQLSNAYVGHVKELIVKVEDLKKELVLKDALHENELLVKDNKINMLSKDLEIAELRNEILRSKLK
jgi:hypothetical protein